jgi:CheY-like chemotaxis protein
LVIDLVAQHNPQPDPEFTSYRDSHFTESLLVQLASVKAFQFWTSASGPPPGSETVFFVEDDERVRELVRDYLRSAGYRVLEASDGIQALEASEAHKGAIQILVTDVVMPRLSGRELAARISARWPNVKALYISGYTDDSVLRHGMLEDGAAFLQKPFNLKIPRAKGLGSPRWAAGRNRCPGEPTAKLAARQAV